MNSTLFSRIAHLSLGFAGMMTSLMGAVSTPAAPVPPTWYNCKTREVFTPEKKAWCDRWRVLENATYLVPVNLTSPTQHTRITLKNGRYQRPADKLFVELVNERNWITFGDLNGDGKQDAAVILGVAADPKGQAIGTFLSAVLDVDGKAQAIAPIQLGDRIRLNGPITIGNQSITVPFLTLTDVINRTYMMQEALIERGKP